MDLESESLSQLIDLVDNGSRATASAAQAISRLKGLFQKSEARTDGDLKIALSDLADQVADAKLANADLKLKLAALQTEISEATSRREKLQQYELTTTPAGHLVYRLREQIRGAQPDHYACPVCYEDEIRSMLTPGKYDYTCPRCKTVVTFNEWDGERSFPGVV